MAQDIPVKYLNEASLTLMVVGVALYFLEINIPAGYLQTLLFLLNILLHLPSLWKNINIPYGIDYTAYINQAAQFANGQTDYTQISSLQGPCFYPAGNILHYLPVYYLHTYTHQAEYIMKIVHFIVHSIISVTMSKIAFKYFEGEPHRA